MEPKRPGAQIPIASLLLAAAVVPTSGCKSEDELGALGQLYLDWLDLGGQGNTLYCECAVAAGYYDSVEECYSPPLPPPLQDCIAAVVDDFPEAAEYVECEIERSTDLLDCLTAAGCDGDTYACYQMAFAAPPCPNIPYDAQRAVVEICYGEHVPDPFTCDDGTQIPETWQCDGEPDCEDASDEVDCPGLFMCDDGFGVPIEFQCDGFPDCADGSDENGC